AGPFITPSFLEFVFWGNSGIMNSSTSSSNRGLRRFAFYLAGFLCFPFLAIGLMENYLSDISNRHTFKRDALASRAQSLELLVLGNSQAEFGILPDLLGQPGYNLADHGQSLLIDLELVEHYAPRLPRLHTVMITLSPFSWGYRFASGSNY